MPFPSVRSRRLRSREEVRRMVRETRLDPDQLILPFFVTHGRKVRRPVRSMPGVFQLSVDELVQEARSAHRLGIPAVLLFGIPRKKDDLGSEASDPDGVVQVACRALKDKIPDLVVITDVCLCEYTSHGHCGIVEGREVVNDPSVERLVEVAVSQAKAGADWVAPSDMMDGRVAAIRRGLDAEGLGHVVILSYAVKFASAFYGPFREAAGSQPRFGDRKGYQMDPANIREAVREARLDVDEGADIVMVKPAGPCLDVIGAVRCAVNVPVAAYQVSGEYAMIKAAASKGWLDYEPILMESLLGIRRAGADLIVSYAAREAVRLIS